MVVIFGSEQGRMPLIRESVGWYLSVLKKRDFRKSSDQCPGHTGRETRPGLVDSGWHTDPPPPVRHFCCLNEQVSHLPGEKRYSSMDADPVGRGPNGNTQSVIVSGSNPERETDSPSAAISRRESSPDEQITS